MRKFLDNPGAEKFVAPGGGKFDLDMKCGWFPLRTRGKLRSMQHTFEKSMNPPSHNRRRPGFTLVEILVVIVIILVLAAISFMITGRIRKSANKTITIGNMRQIGVAMLSYNADQGRYPDQNGGTVATGTWDRLLIPFLGYSETLPSGGLLHTTSPMLADVAKIFQTPEDEIARPPNAYKRSFTMPSWSANYQAPGSSAPPRFPSLPPKKGIPYVVVREPDRAAILCQWYTVNNVLGSGAHCYGGRGLPEELLIPSQQVLFADGHVGQVDATMPPDEFKDKYWPKPN